MSKKQKIDVTGSNSPELNNPFAGLEVAGLPAGAPAETTGGKNTVEQKKKSPLRGRVVLRREKAHRGGKTVIVVHDFAPHIGRGLIEELSSKLRKACGCGGTTRDRTIEVQGNQPDKVRSLLEAEGFRVAGIR